MEEEFGVGQGKRDARGGGRPERRFAVPSGTLEAIRNGGRVIDLADQDQPGGETVNRQKGRNRVVPADYRRGGCRSNMRLAVSSQNRTKSSAVKGFTM